MPFGISFRCGTSPHSFLERHDIGDLDSPFTGLVPVTTNSLIVAPIPAQHLLVEVVGHSPSIGARSVLPSVFVGQKAIVRHVVNSNCVEATLQEKILSSFMFASNALVALFQVSVDGFSGHYLQSSHKLELIIDVFQVNACSFRGPEFVEMLFQAVRQEYGVSIDLDSPVVVHEMASVVDLIPDLNENVGVRESCSAGVPLGHLRLPAVEDVVAIASKDADLVSLRELHEGDFVGVGEDRHEAVEACARGRGASRCRVKRVLSPSTAHDSALPASRNGDVVGDPGLPLNSLSAGGPLGVLDDAFESVVAAQLVSSATGASPSAARGELRALAKGRACPILGVVAPTTGRSASSPVLVLGVAGHPHCATLATAALRAATVLSGGRARVGDAGFRSIVVLLAPDAAKVVGAAVRGGKGFASHLTVGTRPLASIFAFAGILTEGRATLLAEITVPGAAAAGGALLLRAEGPAALFTGVAARSPDALVAWAAGLGIREAVTCFQALTLPHAAVSGRANVAFGERAAVRLARRSGRRPCTTTGGAIVLSVEGRTRRIGAFTELLT
mmetsp:Transcript_3060/g.6725  ORF Transcript_3060/g.6725 Transcript_3060/m.6725 type:complete len:560 (-) Transcript_3060:543-2222(-)